MPPPVEMRLLRNQMRLVAALFLVLPAVGCVTRRQLADIQPGMTMAQVATTFGSPDQSEQTRASAGHPAEVSWYYDAYRPKETFVWETVPTSRPPGWRMEPGYTTVGVRYRRFEIVFQNGHVIGRAEFEPPNDR